MLDHLHIAEGWRRDGDAVVSPAGHRYVPARQGEPGAFFLINTGDWRRVVA